MNSLFSKAKNSANAISNNVSEKVNNSISLDSIRLPTILSKSNDSIKETSKKNDTIKESTKNNETIKDSTKINKTLEENNSSPVLESSNIKKTLNEYNPFNKVETTNTSYNISHFLKKNTLSIIFWVGLVILIVFLGINAEEFYANLVEIINYLNNEINFIINKFKNKKVKKDDTKVIDKKSNQK